MQETIALFAGFAILAASGGALYKAYSRLCARFLGGGPDAPPQAGPAALMLTGFSLVTLFILLMMTYTSLILHIPLSLGSFLLAGLLLLLFDHALIFAGYRYSQQLNRQNLSNQLMIQKQKTEASYYQALEEQYDRQRVLIHDIRKHLAAMRDLADEGAVEAVARYVRELESSPALQNRVRICGNRILNVILSRYGEICQKQGIGFFADIRSASEQRDAAEQCSRSVDSLTHSDITALFGNLLENAVEAAQGAAGPYLELLVDTRPGGTLLISLVNSCAAPPQGDGLGGFLSRKPGEQHGIGMKSIRAVVKKYDGTLRQYYEQEAGLFHTIILLK